MNPRQAYSARTGRTGTWRRVAAAVVPPLVPLVVVTAAVELLVGFGAVPSWLVPAPSQVFAAMVDNAESLMRAMWETALGSAVGFAISATLGMGIAMVLSSSRLVQRAFYPYAIFFQTVPIIAVAPLLVIWFGNGINAVIASACIVSVFPIIANTLAGLLSTDAALRDLFRLHRASRLATFWKLCLPFALPNILTGLRIGGGLSVICAIVGEFITTGSGLGGLMTVARQQQRTDLVFAGLLLSAVLGIALFGAINLASARSLRHWHASEQVGSDG